MKVFSGVKSVILFAAFSGSFAAGISAQVTVPPRADIAIATEAGVPQEFQFDKTQRMTVPVRINESAEYAFIVDTGSERTIIANQLAKTLELKPGKSLRLVTISGPATVRSYLVAKLTTATAQLDGLVAPGLDQENLGAFGLLGLDSLQDKKVDIDMLAGTMSVLSSKTRISSGYSDRDMIVVSARRKGGRLILTDAKVNGHKVDIIVDTGSQNSMGNFKLRSALQRQNRKGRFRPVLMQSVTGQTIPGDFTQIRSIEIGGIGIGDLPITFAYNYAMETLGLENRPAIFLGMDALKLFDRVIIDFAKKQVSFSLPKRSRIDGGSRIALVQLPEVTNP